MNIHERLKYLRTELNLTTRVFGDSINLSSTTITNMEKGVRNITERTICDICRVYNVNPNWLINGAEPMFEDNANINEELKDIAKQYQTLSLSDKQLVKSLINSLAEKNNM